jgi:hypothetical protein
MLLFTQTGLRIGGAQIPAGAFSLFVIPGHDDWTLVVNRNVPEGSEYDEAQDLARTPMKTGELYFAHVAPRQCNLRLYYGKTGAWAELQEQ